METKHLTIMFTDMKGFTSRTSIHTREQLEALLDRQEELVRPIFQKFHGNVVKTIGDAFMVVFDSPTNAVLCGMRIQEDLIKHNAKADSEDRMEIRIGINSGEVNMKGEDYFGEAVNIASRIESISEANEVYFSESVYLSMNKNEIPSVEIGIRHLKGIPDDIKVYKVLREHSEIEKMKGNRKAKAEAANSFSKTTGMVAGSNKVSSAPVQITKMILYFLGGAIGLVVLIVIAMWVFKICPPQGPWMLPPWCKTNVQINNIPINKEENPKLENQALKDKAAAQGIDPQKVDERIKRYLQQGLSLEEAKTQALKDLIKN